jgi:hypothetical protein
MGGDLFEHVVNRGKLPEVEAQAVIRSVLVSKHVHLVEHYSDFSSRISFFRMESYSYIRET